MQLNQSTEKRKGKDKNKVSETSRQTFLIQITAKQNQLQSKFNTLISLCWGASS